MATVLAFDFGASSGRAMLCSYSGESLCLQEAHRFDNVPVTKDGVLYWDADALLNEIKTGMKKAWAMKAFDSVAFDTWGVDFVLLKNGKPLAPPRHYRDTANAGQAEKLNAKLGKNYLYQKTGIQQMDINTVCQLHYLRENCPQLLSQADTMLLMPAFFSWALCKNACVEQSEASTTGLLNPFTQDWDWEVIQKTGLPKRLFPPIVRAGTVLGRLCGEWSGELGIPQVPVIATASHDTAAAIAAAGSQKGDLFLSCGTWSLMGMELDSPVIDEKSRSCDLTNEFGAEGQITFLKNIIGLWLIQETRRQYRRDGKEYSYAQMEKMALSSPEFLCFIDPDDPLFATPGDIPGRIREYCGKTGQAVPQSDGAVIRCIYESLALKYSFTAKQLQYCTQKKAETLHLVGGGAKDKLLCQMAADATGLSLVAGPVEATALGNACVQLVALNALPNLDAGRGLIANSFAKRSYAPQNTEKWAAVADRFFRLLPPLTKKPIEV